MGSPRLRIYACIRRRGKNTAASYSILFLRSCYLCYVASSGLEKLEILELARGSCRTLNSSIICIVDP